jgi:hypothetical protein
VTLFNSDFNNIGDNALDLEFKTLGQNDFRRDLVCAGGQAKEIQDRLHVVRFELLQSRERTRYDDVDMGQRSGSFQTAAQVLDLQLAPHGLSA